MCHENVQSPSPDTISLRAQRRWLAFCNPGLRALISEVVGSEAWITDLTQLKQLEQHADDAGLQERWMAVKHDNKTRLAALVKKLTGATVSTDALFDIQVRHPQMRPVFRALPQGVGQPVRRTTAGCAPLG